ncbi:helix-turn-helix domain-containing protein [Plantactinospora sp. B6F1]|uniref:helix-turn-helix domain-containing protein n=1 Tax=Plantactinospora sp. B6F1 TaxID=3158971 RepID=UPI00102C9F44
MIESFRGIPVDELIAALGGAALHPVRLPEPAPVVRGVVIHAPGDPVPEPDLLALCAAPDGMPPPASIAVVVRAGQIAAALERVPPTTAVFSAPDAARWSDLYDRVRWALRDSLGQLAVHDAFQLADALATALGGAVSIEDANRRVVAFSTIPGQSIDDVRRQGILDRTVPDHVEREQWYARLWRETGVLEFTGGTESTSRTAVAIRSGAEPLGSIWVVGARESLSPDADEILRRAVGVVAICLAHQDHFASRGREARGQILRQLLGGVPGGTVPGYALPGATVLVAFARAERAGDDRELLDTRLSDVFSLHAQRFQGLGLAAAIDGRVYALLPAATRARLGAQLWAMIARIAPAGGLLAVGPALDEVAALPQARQQVDRLLALRARSGAAAGDIAYVEDERDALLLAEVAEAVREVPAMRSGVACKIASYDREHGTAYVPTLRAWFEAGGDVAAAADRLHVHANTFRYRMTRAGTLFGLRPDSADERLLLHLQLRLADFD